VKSSKQVFAELDELNRLGFQGSIFFVDDNFIGNRRAVRELLPLMARWQEENGRPFDFYTEASVNLASDDALIDEMIEAGFRSVFLGIETPSREMLKEARKSQNLKLDLHRAVEKLTKAGLEVMGGFIVGFDGDTRETIELQKEFIQSSAIPLAMVGLLMALPGTDLWKRLEQEGRLRGCPTGDQFSRTNFVPNMDELELLEGYLDLMRFLYEPENFYERCIRFNESVGRTPGGGGNWKRDLQWALRGLYHMGIKSTYRRYFWKLFASAYRRSSAFAYRAFVEAAKGEHMIRYTQEDVLPRIRRSIEELKAERAVAREHSVRTLSLEPKEMRPSVFMQEPPSDHHMHP
jgi:radical SAM superfamily enzyme YgiQ (UPF0313 family)